MVSTHERSLTARRGPGDSGVLLYRQLPQGNDTDSFGATAGSILGAYFGPRGWRSAGWHPLTMIFTPGWRGFMSGVTVLAPGVSIDIPAGTAFQYRSLSDSELKFICIAMPPWSGDSEVTLVEGIWRPTV